MNNLKYCLIIIFFLLFSCETLSYIRLDENNRNPTSGNLKVFVTVRAIPFEYKEIGIITVDDGGWGISEEMLMSRALTKARQVGADAILMLSHNDHIGYAPFGVNGYVSSIAVNRKIIRALAIVKTDEK